MGKTIIKFNSVTYAIRAQKLLDKNGIRTHMIKITNTTTAQGCGHGLEIETDPRAALQLIQEGGIHVVEVIPA